MYLVYLPPYSPDLNPIEFIWKSIKRTISIAFVENVNLQRAYHLLSRESKSLSHRGFSFVGGYKDLFWLKQLPIKDILLKQEKPTALKSGILWLKQVSYQYNSLGTWNKPIYSPIVLIF